MFSHDGSFQENRYDTVDLFPLSFRSTRQHRPFLSGRAESTSAADKSQEILPPPNLRQGPTCDNENLNKVCFVGNWVKGLRSLFKISAIWLFCKNIIVSWYRRSLSFKCSVPMF